MVTARGPRPGRWLAALLYLALTTCKASPVVVEIGLEIVTASGDGQYGTVDQTLGTPLRAQVRSEATGVPQEGVAVLWRLESGAGSLVTPGSVTDSTGSTETRLRLGATPGDVTVRVAVANQPTASVTFTAHTVEVPTLTDLSPGVVMAGDTVTLTGTNFSPVAGQDVVLFSGVRGRVLTASSTSLTVEVPRCLPARDVDVRVQLGVVPSGSLALTVSGGGEVTSLAVGGVLDVADDEGLSCFALEGGAGISYLTLVYSASSVGSALHPYELTALSSSTTASPSVVLSDRIEPSVPGLTADPQARWNATLHELEGELLRARRSSTGVPAGAARAVPPAPAPTVGDRRTFHVLNSSGGYDDVSAVARHVGASVAIFVDEAAPAGGFQPADLATLGDRFDDVIHPLVSTTFGPASDLDGNGKVVILFTPAVNRLTPRGSSGFVGGFFYGNDLLAGNTGSNAAEVLYALVPDPDGDFSDARSTSTVLNVVPAIVAHELQHMVHFNARYLQLDAGQEALWLSEGMAQMSEELVARRYAELGDPASEDLFRQGVRTRTRIYLQRPDTVSALFTADRGTVAEYGAAFLHVFYLEDHAGVDLLRRLMRSTRAGVPNVEAEIGREWPDLAADWWAATHLDGTGVATGWLSYPNQDLRAFFLTNAFPLQPAALGPGDATRSGSLWSSSVRYFVATPDSSGSLTLRLGGAGGGPSSPQAVLRLRIVRLS